MSPGRSIALLSRLLSAALLNKLAKHLALLAILAILHISGRASGRDAISETVIFILVLAAAVLHAASRARGRRGALGWPAPRGEP